MNISDIDLNNVISGCALNEININKNNKNNNNISSIPLSNQTSPIIRCMASCHSLYLINNIPNGDPLEIELINYTDYNIMNNNDDMYECVL